MGFLLLLDPPENMHFGIDNQFWQIGPKFKGIKLIPSGAHFVYYSLKDENYAQRQGFWIHISKKHQIFVKQFDIRSQKFINLDQQDEICYQEGVKNMDFDQNLGVYPQSENLSKWVQLSCYIGEDLLKQMFKQDQKMKEEKKQENTKLNIEETMDELMKTQIEKIDQNTDNFINFTNVPLKKVTAKGQDLTKQNFDKSEILSEIMVNENDFLGEFQLAFVEFILCENLTAFEQWKRMVILLCNCEDKSDIFFNLIPILYAQIQELPKDFLTADGNFLSHSLEQMFEISQDKNKKIKKRAEALKSMVVKDFGYQDSIQSLVQHMDQIGLDDDLPEVVDLSSGFISFN